MSREMGNIASDEHEHFPRGRVGVLQGVEGAVELLVGPVAVGKVLAEHLQLHRIVLLWRREWLVFEMGLPFAGGRSREKLRKGCEVRSANASEIKFPV